MDWMIACKALLLGVAEGLTEFIPVSSSGHLIILGSALNFTGEQAKAFDVVVQIGAIAALCWALRARISAIVCGALARRPEAYRCAFNIALACAPAAALGLLFARPIKAALFAPAPVALALIAGGIVILWVERRGCNARRAPRIGALGEITVRDALKVGFAQCFALIPGVSRSGSTIIGALLFGFDRRVATEFSFLMAIPLLLGATAYELFKMPGLMNAANLGVFAIGLLAAFVSALLCVNGLLRFIATHDFRIFAWYRIGFGALILVIAYGGQKNAFRTNEARPAIRNASIHFRSLISPSTFSNFAFIPPSTFSSLALIRNSSSRRSPLVATSADACDSNTASVSTFACSSLKPAPLSRRTNLCVSNVAANDMRGCSLLKSIFYPSRQRCTRSYFINGCEAVIAENDFYVYCPVPGRFLNSVVWRRSCASSAFSSGVRVGWRVRASQRARSAL